MYGTSRFLSYQELWRRLIDFIGVLGNNKFRPDYIHILENSDAIIKWHLTALELREVDDFDLIFREVLRIVADDSESVLVTNNVH